MGRSSDAFGERGSVLLAELDTERSREVSWALRSAGFFVAEAQSGVEALEALAGRVFDVLLCAVEAPGRSGLGLLREMMERDVPVSAIVVTTSPEISLAIDAMRFGAVDLLIQPMALAELIERVVEGVKKGKRRRLLEEARIRVAKLAETAEALQAEFSWHPPSASRLRIAAAHQDPLSGLDAPLLARLSPRERDIARRLAQGLTISGTASELSLSPNTVRNHIKSIFSKLQVRSQVALLSKLVGARTSQP